MSRPHHLFRRIGALLAGGVVVGVVLAGAASAHVSVTPDTAPRGGTTRFTFRVPNEDASASTTKVMIVFPDPATAPFPSLTVPPHPLWTHAVDSTQFATPVESGVGPIRNAPSQITWTADADGIKPGAAEEFVIEVGPLPVTLDRLEFKVLQTYSDGEVVRWIEATPAGGPEPAHPAPTVTLTGTAETTTTTAPVPTSSTTTTSTTVPAASGSSSDDGIGASVVVALVGGGLAVAAAVSALIVSRRRRGPGS